MSPDDSAVAANANTDEPILVRELTDGVCTLTLNRSNKRNALSLELIREVLKALDEIEEDPAARVVVLAAAGPVFSSGHDLKEIRATPTHEFYKELFDTCSEMMMRLLTLRQPVIARVQGPATAAGCQLVATCDLAVAADTATFATPGVNIGLFCSTPMVALSRAVHRKHAMRMLLSGEPISADRAFDVGLVSDVVPADQLDEACNELAAAIASKSTQTLRIGKEAFYRQLELDNKAAYDYASEVMAYNMGEDDAAEGIDAFLEKRAPQWNN